MTVRSLGWREGRAGIQDTDRSKLWAKKSKIAHRPGRNVLAQPLRGSCPRRLPPSARPVYPPCAEPRPSPRPWTRAPKAAPGLSGHTGQCRRNGAREPARPWESHRTPLSPPLLVSWRRMRPELHAGPFASNAHGARTHVGSPGNRMPRPPPREGARHGRQRTGASEGIRDHGVGGGLAGHWAPSQNVGIARCARAGAMPPKLTSHLLTGLLPGDPPRGSSTMPGTEYALGEPSALLLVGLHLTHLQLAGAPGPPHLPVSRTEMPLFFPSPFIYLYSLQKEGVCACVVESIHPHHSLCSPALPPPTQLPLAETRSVNSFWLLIKGGLFPRRECTCHKLIAVFLIKSYLLLEP